MTVERRANEPRLAQEGHSIVLVGSFNPPIFQPAWFAAHDLLTEREAEAAEIEVIHTDVVVFRLEWGDVQVARDRFAVNSARAPDPVVLRDLVEGTFNILSHTPVTAMGINRNVHFEMPSLGSWDNVGANLVPRDFWSEFLEEPGMRSLTVEARRDDELPGYIRVKVEPSNKFEPGVFIQVNHHLGHIEPTADAPNEKVVGALESAWESCQQRASEIVERVINVARQ